MLPKKSNQLKEVADKSDFTCTTPNSWQLLFV